jgi:tetratricopeptide (TPR) repeat protein
MTVPRWQDLAVENGVFPEPTTEENRLVLWVATNRDDSFQYWERIGSVARGEVSEHDGYRSAPATSIRAREWVKGRFGKILHDLRDRKGARRFALPNGRAAEQCGERQADIRLVWAEDQRPIVDLDAIKERWPDANRWQKLGASLFVVGGVAGEARKAGSPANQPQSEQPGSEGSPREAAEKILAAVRQAGDRPAEAVALTDLGAISLNEGDPKRAIAFLEEALALSRQLGDRERESDVLGFLGMALLAVRQPAQARELFQHELAYARGKGDLFAEKLTLERLGVALWNLGDPRSALAMFDQALAVTRRAGDRHQEANLLWQQSIQLAELEERDAAIAKAEEAITLFKLLGKPQASWYGAHLQKYRMGLVEDQYGENAGAAGRGFSPHSYLGGSIVASVMAQEPARPRATQAKGGPSLLRMAMSATKAMANFIGSGFKTTTPEAQRQRLQICAACEHHTGLRCKICGCFTNVKSRMVHEDCPIGKWPA